MHKSPRPLVEIPESLLAPTGAPMKTPKEIAQKLKAIANPYRIQIIQELMTGEKNVMTLNKSVKVSQPALSQHLNKLRLAGIVKCRREQRHIFYYLTEPNMARIMGIVNEMAA